MDIDSQQMVRTIAMEEQITQGQDTPTNLPPAPVELNEVQTKGGESNLLKEEEEEEQQEEKKRRRTTTK